MVHFVLCSTRKTFTINPHLADSSAEMNSFLTTSRDFDHFISTFSGPILSLGEIFKFPTLSDPRSNWQRATILLSVQDMFNRAENQSA